MNTKSSSSYDIKTNQVIHKKATPSNNKIVQNKTDNGDSWESF